MMYIYIFLSSWSLLVNLCLGCTYTISSDTTLYGSNMINGIYGITLQQCVTQCCATADCAAVTWVSDGASCWLKSTATVAAQARTTEVGTSLVMVARPTNYYTCNSKVTSGYTLFGDNMVGSGTIFATAQDCFKACCNTPDCMASIFLPSWGGCYFKSSATVASQGLQVQQDAQLWMITSQAIGTAPTNNPCKRGVAYDDWQTPADFTTLLGGMTWYYGWDVTPSPVGVSSGYSSTTSTVQFVPMIWGQGSVDSIPTIPAGSQYLLGFNEPNFASQSNLSPKQAASLWPQLQTYANAHNIKLVSPAVNFCASPCTQPVDWLTQFFSNCTNCRVDYIAIHEYTCEVDYLKQHLGLYKPFGKPIWITEMACTDQGRVSQFMNEAMLYLDNDPDIYRYAWFSGRSTEIPGSNLLNSGPTLTPLGSTYTSGYSCSSKLSLAESDALAVSGDLITPVWAVAVIVVGAVILVVVVVIVLAIYKKKEHAELV